MAGPVVAAAVVLDPELAAPWWSDLRDSKALTARQRERLADSLRDNAGYGIGSADHDEIDERGIVPATQHAMQRALEALPSRPDLILVDAVTLPNVSEEQLSIIHGDAICISIAAASILAKVERDRIMDDYDKQYPGYGFGHNRGYCTKDHMQALEQHGPCAVHRRSFAPVRSYLEGHQTSMFDQGKA
jgi:ribonuclease HII